MISFAGTREERGKGVRRRVLPSTRIPSNWQSFLRVDGNKEELFRFLAEQSVATLNSDDKEVYCTTGDKVLASPEREDTSTLQPCTQEEADSRMALHVQDATSRGLKKIMIRTNDTDVVVLAVSLFHAISIDELWVAFGAGKSFRYLPVHNISTKLGQSKAKVLPLFHALTGCDTVSFFSGRGKKTAWDIWNVFPELTNTLDNLNKSSVTVEDVKSVMGVIERFIVLLYDRTSVLTDVDQARQQLFTKKCRKIESIPPTKAALEQHILRAVHQGED